MEQFVGSEFDDDEVPFDRLTSAESLCGVPLEPNEQGLACLSVGGVLIPFGPPRAFDPAGDDFAEIYVRRWASDLSIAEILVATHDGLAHEELSLQDMEAQRYPLGPKEYWRSKQVGKDFYGDHLMTNEDFERHWAEEW